MGESIGKALSSKKVRLQPEIVATIRRLLSTTHTSPYRECFSSGGAGRCTTSSSRGLRGAIERPRAVPGPGPHGQAARPGPGDAARDAHSGAPPHHHRLVAAQFDSASGRASARSPFFVAASLPPPPVDPEARRILTASQSIHTASCRCLPGDAVLMPRGSVSLPRASVSILWPADAYRETRYQYRGTRYPYREPRYRYFGPPMLTGRRGTDTAGLDIPTASPGIDTLACRCLPRDAVPIPRGSVSLPRAPVSILWPADAYRETRYRYRGIRYPYREPRYRYFGLPMLTARRGTDTAGLGILTASPGIDTLADPVGDVARLDAPQIPPRYSQSSPKPRLLRPRHTSLVLPATLAMAATDRPPRRRAAMAKASSTSPEGEPVALSAPASGFASGRRAPMIHKLSMQP
jgi:hypothetical protein